MFGKQNNVKTLKFQLCNFVITKEIDEHFLCVCFAKSNNFAECAKSFIEK